MRAPVLVYLRDLFRVLVHWSRDRYLEIFQHSRPSNAQSQVIVCASQPQDAQSPSEKHGWPLPVGPGVHAGAPDLLLELPGPEQEHRSPVEGTLLAPHAEQNALRHAAVDTEIADGAPQTSAVVQASTGTPLSMQLTRQAQFWSAKHAV
jgi:hypothetical protein